MHRPNLQPLLPSVQRLSWCCCSTPSSFGKGELVLHIFACIPARQCSCCSAGTLQEICSAERRLHVLTHSFHHTPLYCRRKGYLLLESADRGKDGEGGVDGAGPAKPFVYDEAPDLSYKFKGGEVPKCTDCGACSLFCV